MKAGLQRQGLARGAIWILLTVPSNVGSKTRQEWQAELDAINRRLAALDKADQRYYDGVMLFLRYATRIQAHWESLNGDIYEEKIMKGELLKVLPAEAKLLNGKLEYKFRKPFDELAKFLGSKDNKWGGQARQHPSSTRP